MALKRATRLLLVPALCWLAGGCASDTSKRAYGAGYAYYGPFFGPYYDPFFWSYYPWCCEDEDEYYVYYPNQPHSPATPAPPWQGGWPSSHPPPGTGLGRGFGTGIGTGTGTTIHPAPPSFAGSINRPLAHAPPALRSPSLGRQRPR